MGDSRGNTIERKRRTGPAPSTLAASSTEAGMAIRPARKNAMLYPTCVHAVATTTSTMATQPWSSQLNSYAETNDSQYGNTPYDGWNMKRKMMPAIGGAMPYGHRTAVRYADRPRRLWLARAATNRPAPTPSAVTPNAKTKLLTIEA